MEASDSLLQKKIKFFLSYTWHIHTRCATRSARRWRKRAWTRRRCNTSWATRTSRWRSGTTPIWTAARLRRRCDASRCSKNAFYYSFYYSRPSRCAGIHQDTGTSPKGKKAGNALGIGHHRLSGSYGNMLENVALIWIKYWQIYMGGIMKI